MPAVIQAISGPLRGAIFRLGEEEVTIGRHSSNDLCIGDVSVSRHHCAITFENGRHQIRDLNSHNGTLVNGSAVTECFLTPGDRLGVGDTVFEFLDNSELAPPLSMSIDDRETLAAVRLTTAWWYDRREVEKISGPRSEDHAVAAVGQIGKLLNSTLTADQMGVELAEKLCDFADAERTAVFLARRTDWIVFAWDKQRGRCDNAEFAKAEIFDQVFKNGSFVLTTFIENSGSVMAVPLAIREMICGVIYFERDVRRDPFQEDDLRLALTLSDYIAVALHYSQKLEQLESENHRMRDESQIQHKMVGQSTGMREVYNLIARIAPTDATVLVRGETGTGKELAARAIHDNSPRAGRVFEAINCALMKRDLLESELFGHEKGAFTGAIAQKKGKLEIANGGTVFLDEIAELPEGPQAMLLRVLQDHAFERLGGTRQIRVDIRIIAATNKDLEDAVKKHTFRRDLYYRLNVVSLHMPSLRERREDIAVLAHHFLRRASAKDNRAVTSISPDALAYLEAYDWPGNVRELENAIEHAVVFGCTDQVVPEDLPAIILERTRRSTVRGSNYQDAVKQAKKRIVLDALGEAKGDHSQAAKLLDVHPNNLYRLIRDLGVNTRAEPPKHG